MTKVVHCKKEKYDIYIGRPSPFGNPWSHKSGNIAQFTVTTRKEAIDNFEKWIRGTGFVEVLQDQRQYIWNHLYELKDKTLGCWCSPAPCHGQVLIKIIGELFDK
jgi:Domain of unknown function (DUF4326)